MSATNETLDFDYNASACGAWAVSACLSELGVVVTPTQVARSLPKRNGVNTYSELAHVLHNLRCSHQGICWRDEIPNTMLPAVLRLEFQDSSSHFVAAIVSDHSTVLINDLGLLKRLTFAELRDQGWDGTALHVARSESWQVAIGNPTNDETSSFESGVCIAILLVVVCSFLVGLRPSTKPRCH